MKRKTLLFSLSAAAGAAFCAWLAGTYRRHRYTHIQRLIAGSRIAQTPSGPLEYGLACEGPPVMVLHGAGGGYDMGLLLTAAGFPFTWIAPSRPGYLRTPLETGLTFEEQADAFAALLDVLDIERLPVVGISAGGPPALHFAMRHPDRCSALALVSAVTAPIPPLPPFVASLIRAASRSDFLTWLVIQLPYLPIPGGPGLRGQMQTSAERRARFRALASTVFPFAPRFPGLQNDLRQMSRLQPFPFEAISVPTFVIHGGADRLVPVRQGQHAAERIPDARFLPLPGGDHMAFVTQQKTSRPALEAFLREHTAAN